MSRLTVLLIFTLLSQVTFAEVNVYSARKEALIKPILKQFTDKTGIRVNLVTGKADALIKRMEIEGELSPADALITVDAARLYRAREKGLLQALPDNFMADRVEPVYRDTQNTWIALSARSRVIVYARDKVNPADLSAYEDLVDGKWKGKICVRSSSNIYNQSLMASLIAHHGAEQAEQWANGLVNNFARAPKGGDRDQIQAVAAGQCQLALVNTYYVGGMHESTDTAQRQAVNKVAVFWPNQQGRGSHVNVSGIGITKSAQNREAALQLIEFLLSDEAQRWYADTNFEYPVVPGIAASQLLQSWGEFKADTIDLEMLGKNNADAVRIMDRAGWK